MAISGISGGQCGSGPAVVDHVVVACEHGAHIVLVEDGDLPVEGRRGVLLGVHVAIAAGCACT